MAENDLTSRIAQYLDRHLIFPLLEFLSSHNIYEEKAIVEMKVDLLANTNMVDFAMDCYKKLKELNATEELVARRGNIVEELTEKRERILQELVELTEQVSPFIDLFDREDVKRLIETDREHSVILEHLRTNYQEVRCYLILIFDFNPFPFFF